MKRLLLYLLCLPLVGCVSPPDTMTVTDPKGKALAIVNFKKQEIRLTTEAMRLLIPQPRRR
jgi:starvation-inducible outer membrane lipoprotein